MTGTTKWTRPNGRWTLGPLFLVKSNEVVTIDGATVRGDFWSVRDRRDRDEDGTPVRVGNMGTSLAFAKAEAERLLATEPTTPTRTAHDLSAAAMESRL